MRNKKMLVIEVLLLTGMFALTPTVGAFAAENKDKTAESSNAEASESDTLFQLALSTLASDPTISMDSLNWYRNETVEATEFKNFVILKNTLDAYEGGAHGMTDTTYTVFDRAQAAVVPLAKVIGEDQLAAFTAAAEKALREKYDVAPDAPLSSGGFFDDNFQLTDNFFLTEEGVGLHWNPYEIAPYSAGEIEVVVAFEIKK